MEDKLVSSNYQDLTYLPAILKSLRAANCFDHGRFLLEQIRKSGNFTTAEKTIKLEVSYFYKNFDDFIKGNGEPINLD